MTDTFPLTIDEGKKLTPYEFTITNICEKEIDYYINLETLATENPLKEEYLRASLTTDEKDVFSDTLKDDYINKERVITDSTKAYMLQSGTLLEKETKTFNLRLWLDVDTPLSSDTMNRTYQGKVTVTTTYVPDTVIRNMMITMSIATNSGNSIPVKNNTYTQNGKYSLSRISFENRVTNYENVTEIIDFSADGDKSVQGHYVKDNPDVDDSKYTLHIQANGKIQVNPNGYAYFSMPDDIETIFEGIENVDTSNVENMSYMFYKYNGENLDLSGFNTRNITTMEFMFYDCSNLTSLNIGSFMTSKVTTMGGMFSNCSSLTGLDVSHFDTNNVNNMSSMFANCNSLTNLDISNFDTSKVTNMSFMFERCSGLTDLDLGGIDTSQVTAMSYMFGGCSSLASLDVSNFDTSKVTNMSYMFNGCSGLTTLDLSSFDTDKVTDMHSMFHSCSGLTRLDLSNFDTGQVTNMSFMFYSNTNLTSLDLSSFDTTNVTDMGRMFNRCFKLTTTLTIKCKSNSLFYREIFQGAATYEGGKITLNYTSETSDLVDKMIATKSDDSNVVKGVIVS